MSECIVCQEMGSDRLFAVMEADKRRWQKMREGEKEKKVEN